MGERALNVVEIRADILIVDDDDGVRVGLERILRGSGVAAAGAATAEEGLEVLSGRRFDLILTDLEMPGMDGLAFLEEVKRVLPDTPVVMITAYGSMDIVIRALRAGVSDFVTKPFKPEELLGIVKREVGRPERVAAPSVIELELSSRQLDEIDRLLAEMRAEIAARCILLVEGTGHLIEAKGSIEDLNVAALATLVAGDFAATSGIASLIGEEEAFRLNYHEGERYSVYSAQIAPQIFLLIVFGQAIKLGSVLYTARQAIPDLRAVVARSPSPAETGVERDGTPEPHPLPPSQADVPMDAVGVAEREELFSFEDVMEGGLLDEGALEALDAQFDDLWAPGEGDA
jgi:CheY-like chemotaxis protein